MSQSFTRGTDFGMNGWTHSETPAGLVNSANTLYTCANAYVGGSLIVWLNGQRKFPTDDFNETSPGAGTFTFVTAPATGASVRVDYMQALSVTGNADTVDGIHGNKLYPEGGFVGFRAYNSADDTVDSGDTIICNTEIYDIGSNYNNTTGIFTAPYAGYYHFDCKVHYSPTIDQNYYGFTLTGSSLGVFFLTNQHTSGTSGLGIPGSQTVHLSASETVTLKVLEGAAGSPTLKGRIDLTMWSGHLIAKT